jgi:hypothetical protein
MKNPRSIKMNQALEDEIRSLIPGSEHEDFSHMARHLFRLGIEVERERRRLLSGAIKTVAESPRGRK